MLRFYDRTMCVSRSQYLPSHNRGILVPKEPTTIGGHLRKRRLELQIHQSEAAQRLNVSLVTLSKWECDKVYPVWAHQPKITAYLGFNPFTNPAHGGPKSNESRGVAILSSDSPLNLGQQIVKRALELRKNLKEFARNLGISPKTVWNWERNRRKPSAAMEKRVSQFLSRVDTPKSVDQPSDRECT